MSAYGLPLGKTESQKLEFKSKDVLQDLSHVGREVTAMLNAREGGVVWIGIAEEQGRAVRVESIDDPQLQVGRLRDHLLDSIEPSPREEVKVTQVSAGNDQQLLWIQVTPALNRQPYAHLKGTGRHYLVRVADRIRLMTREEIREKYKKYKAIGAGTSKQRVGLSSARGKIYAKREGAGKEGKAQLWLMIRPESDLGINRLEQFEEILQDPIQTGNRINGWNFANPYERPTLGNGKIIQEHPFGPRLEIRSSGEITFTVPQKALHHSPTGPLVSEKEIWPFCLLEYPTSVFRLASTIYKQMLPDSGDPVWSDFAIFKVRGWLLRPYSPYSVGFEFGNSKTYEEAEDLILVNAPFQFSREEIIETPDRCAFRILCSAYAAFSFGVEMLPIEFDRGTGRLTMR
ncbi:MAG: ATP-binding protein [Planctomycetes bacterium]|nr:ATP-binding protein [Planctomycetota bacterium]